MGTPTLACTATPAAARLLIHTAGDARADDWTFGSLIQRLRSRDSGGPRNQRALLALEIHDLHGYRVLALDDAGPLVDVALPAGTYHITAQRGTVRRGYTITLERGASFDLHVRFAPA